MSIFHETTCFVKHFRCTSLLIPHLRCISMTTSHHGNLSNANLIGSIIHRKKSTIIDTKALIQQHTELTRDHLTPEIKLHLVTKNCKLWYSKPEECPFLDPYWAFYWPGGQALTRYILDNAKQFKDQNILDVGSGCGASAIACVKAEARNVQANDIDKIALRAINMNATANQVSIATDHSNMIGRKLNMYDIVLLGDMFYDTDFSRTVFEWIQCLIRQRTRVIIGDPGRLPFLVTLPKIQLKLLAKYSLTDTCRDENNGLTSGYVWEFMDLK